MENIAKLFGLTRWTCSSKEGYVYKKNHILTKDLNFSDANDVLYLLEELKNNKVSYAGIPVERRFFSLRPQELFLTFAQQIGRKHVEFHSVVYLKEEDNSIQKAIVVGINDIATQIINFHKI